MPTSTTPVPFKPSDLLNELKRHLDTTRDPRPEGTYTRATGDDWVGRDNWSVHTFVTITAPDGRTHRLRLEIHDVPQEG